MAPGTDPGMPTIQNIYLNTFAAMTTQSDPFGCQGTNRLSGKSAIWVILPFRLIPCEAIGMQAARPSHLQAMGLWT